MDEEEDNEDTREFGSVITNLQASYPPEKMEEISTSFCFICLLHLANEEGLKIRHGPDGDMDAENEEGTLAPPGNLWDLQVSPSFSFCCVKDANYITGCARSTCDQRLIAIDTDYVISIYMFHLHYPISS